ncbi:hypothetical protein PaecuDRAFT_2580 [Paenibacillus curdlanolyticus YK9]|uniref:Uncharacterized protein n=1 Tax=Paenibacillus curdlanolyticus YK9 TaxID=717606 RepID=E0IA91_9BACL|nr:hypothetical protein [Paenibacillus curdlanolyticus]EFM10668.1 hypothetical protein PaecuDRAFT_2580 [Paenibacillus curdlanolyticus YK9]
MIPSKLILMEGLPSTGKSTNAGILFTQLERNGHKARWIHEVARPHPTLFFYEAYLEKPEYDAFIARHPHAAAILDAFIINRNRSVGIDLLELEWHHLDALGSEAHHDLSQYDAWTFSLDRYRKAALDKWEHFVQQHMQSDEIVILDSSIFQFQIYSFILADAPYDHLKSFIDQLYAIIAPLQPSLIYFHRENTNDTIDYLTQDRGTAFLERIWERDRYRPYYTNRPAGAAGYKMFLQDYGTYAKKLFDSAPFAKLALDITAGTWPVYVDVLLRFSNLSFVEPVAISYPNGIYSNAALDQSIEIANGYLITPDGGRKRLLPKSEFECYLHDTPVLIRFEGNEIHVGGEQLCDRWTAAGTVFIAQDHSEY